MSTVRSLPVALLALAATACGHELEDGRYDFVATGIRQDTCTPDAPREAGDLPDGDVRVRGDSIRIDHELHRAEDDRALLGRFLDDDDAERFIADATFDVVTPMGPGPGGGPSACLAFAHLHVAGFVDDPRRFHGELRIDYRRRPEAAPECLASCTVDLEFEATRIGPVE